MKPYPKCKDSGVEWIGVVSEGLYNDAQREEWVWLFAIDEIKKDPRGKEDLEWFMSVQNPVTLNKWRAGFCILWSSVVVKDKSIKDLTL